MFLKREQGKKKKKWAGFKKNIKLIRVQALRNGAKTTA